MTNIDSAGSIIRSELLKRGYSTSYSENQGTKHGLTILTQVLDNGVVFFVNIHWRKVTLYVRDSSHTTLSRAEFSDLDSRFGTAAAVLTYIKAIESLHAGLLPGGFDDLPAEEEQHP